ncbi:MAG TPA: AIM24 family protein [Acidimicrobiales bacterium]|nr:AIM24 family protein [Acidimicrobiales bacterium]
MEDTLRKFTEIASDDSFTLQNNKLLKVRLDRGAVQAALGSMVAYQGDVRFEHAGSGGVGRFIKKTVTGEGTRLMKVTGTGEVFFADQAQDVHLLRLADDRITCNGRNVLAFDANIDWDIKRVQGGAAGALAGGLFNLTLAGSGFVAVVTDGPPVLLDIGSAPTFADAQAAVAWSAGVVTSLKTDVNLKTLIGRGSGETFQLGFSGQGWVLVQPSEGQVVSES